MLKSVCDIFIAFIVFVSILPILILVTLLILIIEQKTAFFLQERIGKNKKEFRIYKFRTMDDGKITSIGNVLRKTGIDELPQLINIILGEMSVVGPRPLTESDIIRLQWNDKFHEKRWYINPGIVGLAQLTPVCHKKMSWFYDQLYLKHQTLWMDMKILFAAVLIPFVGKNTVKNWIHG